MDLLFKRYASPFLLLDGYLSAGKFSDFIVKVVEMHNKETSDTTLWEFYLNKVNGMSFEEFKQDLKLRQLQEAPVDFESALKNTKNMLNGFDPNENNEEI